MKRSLFLRILLPLFLVLSLCWIVFIFILGRASFKELHEVLDQQMIQTAQMLTVPMDYSKLPELYYSDPDDEEYRIHFVVWNDKQEVLVADQRGEILPSSFDHNGFYKVSQGKESYRVYTYHNPLTKNSASAGYPSSVKEEILHEVVEKFWLPWFLGLAILALVVLISIRWGLMPLSRLRREMESRDPRNLEAFTTEVPVELENLKAELNRLVAQIRKQMEKERRFTADAAHELKTPLAAIRVQTEVLEMDLPDGEMKAQARKIMQGVDRTDRLVEQLLALSRLDERTMLAKKSPLQVQDIFLKQGDILSDLLRNKEAKLSVSREADFALEGDELLMGILFKNLIENSLKYSPNGVSIHLAVNAQGFSVADTGPGMSAEYLQRAKERFYRPEGQAQPGSGLGLSVVEKIAEIHGLKMSLENREQSGLVVHFVR